MLWSGLDRAYYFAIYKDTDDIYGERVKFDRAYAEQLREKARIVTTAVVPPVRLNDNPEYYQCRYCDFKDICHGKRIPDVSCRTCAHATPNIATGKFDCGRGYDYYDCKYCADHLYIPDLIPYPVTEVCMDDIYPSVSYMVGDEDYINGPDGYSSKEIKAYLNELKP
jgi:hypothetical protein